MQSVHVAKIKVLIHVEIFKLFLRLQNIHNYKLQNKANPVGCVNSKNNRYGTICDGEVFKI